MSLSKYSIPFIRIKMQTFKIKYISALFLPQSRDLRIAVIYSECIQLCKNNLYICYVQQNIFVSKVIKIIHASLQTASVIQLQQFLPVLNNFQIRTRYIKTSIETCVQKKYIQSRLQVTAITFILNMTQTKTLHLHLANYELYIQEYQL